MTANNYTFTAKPAFLKFSFALDGWTWFSSYRPPSFNLPSAFSNARPIGGLGGGAHRQNALRFRIVVRPRFGSATILADTPQVGMTSVWLLPAPGQPGALLRFLDFGLHSSSVAKDDRSPSAPSVVVPCAIEAHHNDSTLTMTFAHFGNGSVLVYDPGTSTTLRTRTQRNTDVPVLYPVHRRRDPSWSARSRWRRQRQLGAGHRGGRCCASCPRGSDSYHLRHPHRRCNSEAQGKHSEPGPVRSGKSAG